jgi:hypothetical protein
MLSLNVNLLQNLHLHGSCILFGRVNMLITIKYSYFEPNEPSNWGWTHYISLVILNRVESTTNLWEGACYNSPLIGVMKGYLHWIPFTIPPR